MKLLFIGIIDNTKCYLSFFMCIAAFFCLYRWAASSQTCLMSEAWPIGGASRCAAWHPTSPLHRHAAQSTVRPTKCPGRERKRGRKGWREWEMRERRNGGRELLSWREHREITVHRVRLHAHTHTQFLTSDQKGTAEYTGHELIVLHPCYHLHWESLFHSDLCLLITHTSKKKAQSKQEWLRRNIFILL